MDYSAEPAIDEPTKEKIAQLAITQYLSRSTRTEEGEVRSARVSNDRLEDAKYYAEEAYKELKTTFDCNTHPMYHAVSLAERVGIQYVKLLIDGMDPEFDKRYNSLKNRWAKHSIRAYRHELDEAGELKEADKKEADPNYDRRRLDLWKR